MKNIAHWPFLALALCVLPFPMAGQTNGPEPRIRPSSELAQTSAKLTQMDISPVLLKMTVTDLMTGSSRGWKRKTFAYLRMGKSKR
jgi:hypothetical protein